MERQEAGESLQNTPPELMKRPAVIWQVIAICVAILSPIVAGLISQSNTVSELRTKVTNLELKIYDQQINSDKKFEKIDSKIDLIQNDTRQILINLEKKADRK